MNYSAPLKSTRMQAVIAEIDAAGPGALEICTAGFADVLLSFALPVPSFTEAGGVITMAGVPLSAVASKTGEPDVARIKNGAGDVVVDNLSVGTVGTDIVLANMTVSVGETVPLASGAIAHA